jgi:hypothetical protein
MIHVNNKDISGVYSGSKEIIAVYSGLKLVWSKINELLCCFANGYWMDEYPWQDDAPWKD